MIGRRERFWMPLALALLFATACGEETKEPPKEYGAPTLTSSDTVVDFGTPAVLTWSAPAGARVHISQANGMEPGGVLVEDGAATGTLDVTPVRATTYTLIARIGGTAQEASVHVAVRPVIEAFRADAPAVPAPGSDIELQWKTRGAESVVVSNLAGESHEAAADERGEGTTTLPASQDGIFRLEATLEDQTVRREVSVDFGVAPQVLSFTASPEVVFAGGDVRLSWSAARAESFSIAATPGGPIDVSGLSAEGGSIDLAIMETTVFELEVVNAAGDDRATVEVLVVPASSGPRIVSFEAEADRVGVGDDIELHWVVAPGTDGVVPAVSLADDRGGTWSIDDADRLEGAIAVASGEPGPRTFTLTATAAGHDPVSAEVVVTAFLPPAVTIAAADVYDPGTVRPLELSWTAANATTLLIREVDEDGEENPIHAQNDPAEEGTLLVSPRRPTTYRAVAVNAIGREAVAETRVEIAALRIEGFDADPIEIIRGDSSTLTWSVVGADRVEVGGLPWFERTWDPFIDLTEMPTALPLPPDTCGTGWADDGCALVTFPNSFVFPFDGVEHTRARIYVNGLISFDLERTGDSRVNFPIPSTAETFPHLVPFWDDLGASGREILVDDGVDAKGRYLVIQWVHAGYGGDSDLEFEVILREDGEFEFRYRDMFDPDDYERSIGSRATIGFQDLSGTDGVLISHHEAVWDLPYAGYRFRAPTPGGFGSATARPWETQTYTLTAYGFDGTTATADATIIVHEPVDVMAVLSRSDVDLGESYELRWSAPAALGLTISDDLGPVHTATAAELAFGTLRLTADALGPRTFTLEATGALGTRASTSVTVTVWVPFGIDSFTVDSTEIAPGEDVLLTWTSHGAESFQLLQNGVPLDTGGQGAGHGSIVVQPDFTAEYELIVSRDDGRTFSRKRTVRVVRVTLDEVNVPADTRIALGESVNVSWDATSRVGDPVSVLVLPAGMRELAPGTAPFEDISATGTELTSLADVWGAHERVDFPAGFEFPFMGERKSAMRVMSNGYVSFDPNAHTAEWRRGLPAGANGVHLAPFWEELRGYGAGHVYAGLVSDAQGDRFIVQWKAFQYIEGHDGPGANLNFEVVLFRDGSFEFRYATMSSPAEQTRADGENAIAGYQDASGRFGWMLFDRAPLAGGLSNRAWRFDAARPASGTAPAIPGRDGKILICAVVPGAVDCKEHTVAVDAPGDLAITEIQIDPDGGPSWQWFEVQNVSSRVVRLDGMVLRSGSGSHTIASGAPILLPPGAYFTLAASEEPGFEPDYVYGAGLAFSSTLGDVAVSFHGVRIASVEWDGAVWPISPGASVSLDGVVLTPTYAARHVSDPWGWCPSTDVYLGNNAGSPGAAGGGCPGSDYDVDYYANVPFIDISATGTPIPEANEHWGSAPVPGGLPFSFPFFWGGNRTDLWVNSYGTVGFRGYCDLWGCGIDAEQGLVFAFRDELTPQPGSMVHSELRTVDGRQVVIVQWTGVALASGPGSLTFQVQLWERGDIVIAYAELEGGLDYQGAHAFVGIQAPDYMNQILYSDSAPILWPGQALLYRHK